MDCVDPNILDIVRCETRPALACGLARGDVGASQPSSLEESHGTRDRSAQAYEVLKQAGYPRINNLQGGILAWADRIDPTMAKY